MGYLFGLVVVGGILFGLYKLVLGPPEEPVQLTRGDDVEVPAHATVSCRFEADAQIFTNDHSRTLEHEAGEGHGPFASSLALGFAIEAEGWVIARPARGPAEPWPKGGKLWLLVRGAGAPTAVRIVADTPAGQFSYWHDALVAGEGWGLLSIPVQKLEAEGGAPFGGGPVDAVSLELHPDRKLALRGEEERHLLLAGFLISPS